MKVHDDLNQIMRGYADQLGKPTWCEKSVFTIDGIDAIELAFPEARYICLYRNCLDQVRSAIDALKLDPSGRAYGFDPYLIREPENQVNALIDYWCAKTSAILKFEQENTSQCVRLHYEDIVLESNTHLKRLFGFLRSHWVEQMLDSIFKESRKGGPGDHKIIQSDKILISSVGRGKELNIQSVSVDRFEKVNNLHEALGYCTVER